jgi:hypothetical protein
MGAAAAPAVGLGLAATGVKMFGDYESAQGAAAGDEFRAETLARAAQYGDLQANQVNAQLTRNLAITLAHIDATRAAGHADPFSPSGEAVREATSDIATQQKEMRVSSILEQSQQDEADAAYLRYAGSRALLAGDIGMAGTFLGGAASAVKSLSG